MNNAVGIFESGTSLLTTILSSISKISQAMQHFRDESIPFVTTNTDGQLVSLRLSCVYTPGTGCIMSAVETAASREPIVIGKPSTLMYELVESMYDLDDFVQFASNYYLDPFPWVVDGDRCN